MLRRSLLIGLPAVVRATEPGVQLSCYRYVQDTPGTTEFGVFVWANHPDTAVRAFEVRVRWKPGAIGDSAEKESLLLMSRQAGGPAVLHVPTGLAREINVEVWALRRQEYAKQDP